MEENVHRIFQHELEVQEVMRVHCGDNVFPSIYPCPKFLNVAGILQDFHTLVTKAGLQRFIEGKPFQYVKLTMSMVQDLF